MKVRASVKKICRDCKIVKEREHCSLFVQQNLGISKDKVKGENIWLV